MCLRVERNKRNVKESKFKASFAAFEEAMMICINDENRERSKCDGDIASKYWFMHPFLVVLMAT